MIFFNKQNIQAIDQKIIQAAIEGAYELMLSGQYNMPDRIHAADGQNVLLLMPCFSKQFFATKLVSVFPDAHKYGKPAVNGVLVLNDNKTGEPLAFFDGAAVTAQRTGAVGGLAVKMLTDSSIRTAGIFGAGVQGYQQARFLLFNRNVEQLSICDLNADAAQMMIDKLSEEYGRQIRYQIYSDPNQLVQDSQVVIAATTSSRPLFDKSSSALKGKVFISIGSFRPDMQEFPNSVIEAADEVYVDTMFACKESGDIAIPLSRQVIGKSKIKEFAQLMKQSVKIEEKTLFFKSVGMALFDLATAIAIYELSKTNQIGVKMDL